MVSAFHRNISNFLSQVFLVFLWKIKTGGGFVPGLINYVFWKLLPQAHHYCKTLFYPTPVPSLIQRLLIPALFIYFSSTCGSLKGTTEVRSPLLASHNSLTIWVLCHIAKKYSRRFKLGIFPADIVSSQNLPHFSWARIIYFHISMGTSLSWSGTPQEGMGECNCLYFLMGPWNWVGQHGTRYVLYQKGLQNWDLFC